MSSPEECDGQRADKPGRAWQQWNGARGYYADAERGFVPQPYYGVPAQRYQPRSRRSYNAYGRGPVGYAPRRVERRWRDKAPRYARRGYARGYNGGYDGGYGGGYGGYGGGWSSGYGGPVIGFVGSPAAVAQARRRAARNGWGAYGNYGCNCTSSRRYWRGRAPAPVYYGAPVYGFDPGYVVHTGPVIGY